MAFQPKFDAVIFDLDGVITDTAALHAAAWKEMFDDVLNEITDTSGGKQPPFDKKEDYLRYVDGKPKQNAWTSLSEIPTHTEESDAMSKSLKKCGFKFVGSTICYAFMQAVGMVNDHTTDCFRYKELLQG